MADTAGGATPRHLWIVGVIALLWNALGAFDYTMTQTKNEAYMSNFTPEQLDFFYSIPAWAVACWAIAVWGGVLGSILLLLRKKAAEWVFLVGLIALALVTLQNYVLSNGLEAMGDPFSMVFTGVIILTAIGLYVYSRAMARRGVLT